MQSFTGDLTFLWLGLDLPASRHSWCGVVACTSIPVSDGTESPEGLLVLAYILWVFALYNGIDDANHITRGQEQWVLVTCVHDEYLQHVWDALEITSGCFL